MVHTLVIIIDGPVIPGVTLLEENAKNANENKTIPASAQLASTSVSLRNIRGELMAGTESEKCVEICSFPKSALFFVLPLALHFAIGVSALLVAFLIRKVPDNFRDTFSILSLETGAILLTILYVPLHYIVKNKPLEMYAF